MNWYFKSFSNHCNNLDQYWVKQTDFKFISIDYSFSQEKGQSCRNVQKSGERCKKRSGQGQRSPTGPGYEENEEMNLSLVNISMCASK